MRWYDVLRELESNQGSQAMSKASRTRIDYTPCKAALKALQAAQGLHPKDNTQALIDRQVIVGYSALVQPRWEPPHLYGRNREAWKLPQELREHMPEDEA